MNLKKTTGAMKKVTNYREDDGEKHVMDTIQTHL